MAVLAPSTVKHARKLVASWHRHLPEVQGGLFAVGVIDGGQYVGVGIAGNPPRVWQGTGKLVITRVATPGFENACSMIYGALRRAAKALGYAEVWTYTLPDEPGTSLRAAGFIDMGLTDGGEWSRPSRSRKRAMRPEPKRRWVTYLNGAPSTVAAKRAECPRRGDEYCSHQFDARCPMYDCPLMTPQHAATAATPAGEE